MSADLVLRDAEFYLDDGRDDWTDAVAVEGGVISATGDQARESIGASTRVVSVEGATVLPGFIDAHVHPIIGGRTLLRCSLAEFTECDDYLAAVQTYAQGLGPNEWITGGGWSMSAFDRGVPDAASLDGVSGGRPALLYNRDTHSAWVNTAALRLAGIDATTADPAGGRIERDADGVPSGALHDAAMTLVSSFLPPESDESRLAALRAGQKYLNDFGITEWQDAKVLPEDIESYLTLQDRGQLTARVVGAFWLDPERGVEQCEDILRAARDVPPGLFSVGSVKIMLDGVCETFTAHMHEPYSNRHDHGAAGTGIKFFDADLLIECARRLDATGFQLHFHAVGDAAVTEALDTVEAVRLFNGPSPNRPHVAHVQVVRPADVYRFRSLGVSVNAQPLWARLEPQMTELTLPFLGPERGHWQYPFGDMESAGARLAFGSDWPVSTPDPIRILHVAVNRSPVPVNTTWNPTDGAFLPEQRLSLPTALRAYTRGSAWLNRHENLSGAIRIGTSADFAVLDSNPFTRPRAEIWRSKVIQTWLGGEQIA